VCFQGTDSVQGASVRSRRPPAAGRFVPSAVPGACRLYGAGNSGKNAKHGLVQRSGWIRSRSPGSTLDATDTGVEGCVFERRALCTKQ
jgi:hypothetical protein